jgi:RNA polymerase sigma-70 factor (ECF subfamily)
MTPPAGPDLQALLAHAGRIRSLARSLVADSNRVDDLVQQTWVAALEHPPGPATPLKRWLAAVLRNFARQERRGEQRRAERESSTARPEATKSAHDTVEGIAIQRALFEVVLALDEPYRSAIYRRYYEGLPPREIARRDGVPVKTVKTRLSRGLEKLRAELDRRNGGDRQAWLPALIPLAGWPGLPAAILGAALVNTKIKIAVVAVVLAGATTIAWRVIERSESTPMTSIATSAPDLQPLETQAATLAATPTAGERVGASAPSVEKRPASSTGDAAEAHPLARGRVIDVEGRPVGGVPLAFVPIQEAARRRLGSEATSSSMISRADGTFEIPIPKSAEALVAASPEFATVLGVDIWSSIPQEGLTVVVAPAIDIAGVVVDADGQPVPEAEIEVRAERVFLRSIGGASDASFEVPFRTKSGPDGRFELEDAPAVPARKGATLDAHAPGYQPWSQPSPERPVHDLRIVLAHGEHLVLRGEVVDPADKPVARAYVECGDKTTLTDERGRFEFEPGDNVLVGPNGVADGSRRDEVLSVKAGFLPGRVHKPEGGWPAFLTVRLGGTPLSTRGRVVDPESKPVAGAEVSAIDEHPFGPIEEEVGHIAWLRSIEGLLRGDRFEDKARADAEGKFEIGGLMPGSYRFAAFDGRTLRSVSSEPIAAGSRDVVLTLPRSDACKQVAGRVVSLTGKSVPGVLVFPGKPLEQWAFAMSKDLMNVHPLPPTFGRSATTDPDGRFHFDALATDGLCFQVSGRTIDIMFRWDPPSGAALDQLEIVVSMRCHLQVDLGGRAGEADAFFVLDGEGKKLTLNRWRGPTSSSGQNVPVVDGRSDVVSTTEAARTVVLTKAGQEVSRIPITPVPGEVVVARL